MTALPTSRPPLPVLRPPGAVRRLHALVQARAATPFAWGVHDCCLWAADAVHAATGRDPAAGLRGTYATARQAARLVQRLGGLPALLAARAGACIAVHQAIDGDLCLLRAGTHQRLHGLGAVGVLWRGRVLAPAGHGLVAHPVDVAEQWWGVQP